MKKPGPIPHSTITDPREESFRCLLALSSGISPDELANATDRRGHTLVAAYEQLPIKGTPGYRERMHQLVAVDLDGAAERIEVLQAWLDSGGLPVEDHGRAQYQIERLREDIECARVWKAMGVEFGDAVDPLFRTAVLPHGWKLKPTDHAMWSKLVDERGRTRASMFYKAAFYDRDAFIHFERRFSIRRDYSCDRSTIRYVVRDGEQEIFAPPAQHLTQPKSHTKVYYDKCEAIERHLASRCEAWLVQRYPNYADPADHWDDP